MKKSILILVLVSLFSIGAMKYTKGISVYELEKYSVRIMSLGYGGMGRCTGTVISNTKENTSVLTCKHCIDVDREFTVENQKVKRIVTIPQEDVAYLLMYEPFKNKESAKIATENAKEETKVMMYGQPGYTIKHIKSGEVLYYTDDWGFAKLDVIPGCSGAGLFNAEGELVGVVWGAYAEGQEERGLLLPPKGGNPIGIFEPISDVKKLLREIDK
jgi:hypothetical protein